mgnify:CR=1 FL=1
MTNEQKLNEELAYALSKKAHHGQKYGGHDYFKRHVLGVADNFSPKCEATNQENYNCIKCGIELERNYSNPRCASYDHEAYIVALLHDVVEDSHVTDSVIFNLFGHKISHAVELLTRETKTHYDLYIEALTHYPLARKVKIADLEFHLSQPVKKNQAKYEKALAYLKAVK